MKRRLLLLALFAQLGCLSAQVSDPAPTAFSSLLTNSPFSQPTGESGAPALATALELRGVIVDNGEVLFSVFDPASRSSHWVGLNEPGNPFTVRSYDQARSEVKVNYQGRELTLGLKQATIIALAAPPVPAAGPVPLPGSTGGPRPASASGAPSDEAVRLAQIAEEIGRRRALRLQAGKQRPNQGQPTPAPPK